MIHYFADLSPQELLEKFEFFPLKCHVQRSLEIFKLNNNKRKNYKKLKSKVNSLFGNRIFLGYECSHANLL